MNTNAKNKWLKRFKLSLLFIWFLSLIISYFLFRAYQNEKTYASELEASLSLSESTNLILNEKEALTLAEYDRCQEFVLSKSGEFAEFQYCEGYIDWFEVTLSGL